MASIIPKRTVEEKITEIYKYRVEWEFNVNKGPSIVYATSPADAVAQVERYLKSCIIVHDPEEIFIREDEQSF